MLHPILDACSAADPLSIVACETACKDNLVMVLGEITTKAKLDYDKIVINALAKIGYDRFEDDFSAVDIEGLND